MAEKQYSGFIVALIMGAIIFGIAVIIKLLT